MIDYKFNEDENINELKKHIDSTYDSHYSKEQFQATEFIVDGGHGTGFCIGNIMKYAQRYGKKGDAAQARKDLMKILHYAIIQLHVHDLKKPKHLLLISIAIWIIHSINFNVIPNTFGNTNCNVLYKLINSLLCVAVWH